MIASPHTWTEQPHARGLEVAARRQRPCGRTDARVLVVESDAAIAEMLTIILSDEGYAVEHVWTPWQARDLLMAGDQVFDVVISAPFSEPLYAPYAWLDRLWACSAAPIIICGRHPAVFYSDHRRRGYAAYIEEPCDMRDLIDAVATVSARPTRPGDGEPRPSPYLTHDG